MFSITLAQDNILPKAYIDGIGSDWQMLEESDFADVNCGPETWTWENGIITCTGNPIGVLRTKDKFTNFELVLQWRHLKSAGNSGVFAWVPEKALKDLPPDKLPSQGIEVQILDHGFKENYEKHCGL